LQAFGETLRCFFPKLVREFRVTDLPEVLSRICCNNEILTTKIIKYYYCALCSIAYKSKDLPEKPHLPRENNKYLPFFGRFYKAIHRRIATGSVKAVTFASTIFLSRYAAIKVPDTFIKESEKKYIERLTRLPQEKVYNMKSINNAVSQFGKISFSEFVSSGVNCLSVSSCSERHEHGQYGEIEQFAPKVSWEGDGQQYEGICPVPFFSSSFTPTSLTGNVTHLAEPLKVRSITTSSAYEFLAGKPIQNAISKKMKRMENLCFGRTIEVKDVENLVYRSKEYFKDIPEDLYFLSADFEAATDNLSPLLSSKVDILMIKSLGLDFRVPSEVSVAKELWFSMAKIFEFMCIGNELGPKTTKKNWISLNMWIRLRIACSKGKIATRKISDIRSTGWSNRDIGGLVTSDNITQTFGQMMGDIKSFPVLCCINLALWNLVTDNRVVSSISGDKCHITGLRSFKRTSFKAPCQINGDDFLAYAPLSIINKWFELVREFDLVASLGKTYVSKTVAQLNSTNFFLKKNKILKVKTLPVHAVFSIPSNRPVEQSINYAIEHRPELLNRLIFYNKKRIEEVTGGGLINLCLPAFLGGIGVKAEPKRVTTRQLLVARHNTRMNKMIQLKYQWVPFKQLKKKPIKNSSQEAQVKSTFVYRSVPKGMGKVTDQYGIEHIMGSYKATEESRFLQGDNWLASMSRQRFSGRNGRMIIRGEFYRTFAKVSNSLLKSIGKDKRLPKLEALLAYKPENRILVKGRNRLFVEGQYLEGPPLIAPTVPFFAREEIPLDEENEFSIQTEQK